MEESDMSFQIYNWLEKYVHEVVSTFGYRIWFIGVQGSYARGEATEESDIDVVLILDTLLPADLRIYRGMLNRLPYREKICGLFPAEKSWKNWSKADLFQFCQDTMPLKEVCGDRGKAGYGRRETGGSYGSLQSVSCRLSQYAP